MVDAALARTAVAVRHFGMVLLLAALLFGMAAQAQNVSDSTAPEVSSGSWGVSAVDTTSGAQNVSATINATDDLSGFNYAYVYLRTTSSTQPGSTTSISCYIWQLQSGTRTNGTLTGNCSFPQYSQSGSWFAYQIHIYDLVGNYRSYYNGGNALAIFPATLSVTAPTAPVTTPPVLHSLALSPLAVDVSNGAQTLQVDAHVTSTNGFSYGYFYLYDASNAQNVNFYVDSARRISGTSNDGVYRATASMPQYSRAGTWHWQTAYLYDSSGNRTQYSSSNPSVLNYVYFNNSYQPGQPGPTTSTLSVTSVPSDTAAPTLVDFAISPSSIDVAAQAATIAVTVDATDDLSGFNFGCVYFVSPNGQQTRGGCFYPSQRTANIYFPQYSEAGNWRIYYMYLYDRLYNYRYFSANDFVNLGFSSNIQISSGLSVSDATGSVGGTVSLNARLTYLGTPAAGQTIGFAIQGSSVGTAVTDSNGIATLAAVSLGSLAAGTYVNGITANFAGNAPLAPASGRANLVVTNKLDQTITFGALVDRYLNESPITISATASSGLPVSFAAIGSCTVSGTQVTLTGAGNCKIVASQPGNATYNPAPSVSQTFDISAKADQTITFGVIADHRYGDSPPSLSATASSGLAVSYQATGNCSVSGSILTLGAPGSCQVVASQPGNESFNPAPDVTRSFSILRAPLTIKADDTSKVYGAALPAFSATATGLVNGDTLASLVGALAYTTSPGASASSPVGSYSITPSGVSSPNYEISFASGTLSISPAALAIKADDKTKVYGAALPSFTVTATGFVNGDTVASLSGTLSFTSSPALSVSSPVGSYAITPGGLASANYVITFSGGTLAITPAALIIKADDQAKVYGAAMPVFTVTPSGLVNGDTLASLSGGLVFATTPAASVASPTGNYAITPSGLSSANYVIAYLDGTLTITPAMLTVTANAASSQYSDPLAPLSATISGFVNGDGLEAVSGNPGLSTTASVSSAPGSYPITITAGSLAAANYTFALIGAAYTVLPEDARATFTGTLFASTAGATSGSATVALSATVRDITAVANDPDYDVHEGDIRNAMVTFVNRDAGDVVLCTAPVGLVSLADTKVGTATCNWSVDIGQQNSISFTVGIVVTRHYTGNSSEEDAVVTVSRPLTSNFITGGGYLLLSSSAGQVAGAPGSRANFGFNVKYNPSGTNLQGNINAIVRNAGRVYQVKGNAIASMTVQLGTKKSPASTATFSGKANIRDITDPANPISVDGNATLQVVMTDLGQAGTGDSIAISVLNKQGGMWFSSNWNGTNTVQQPLAGGDLVVH